MVHAFVVPRAGHAPDVRVLSTLVRTELGAASVPATITVDADVPLLPGGKPDKAALRARIPTGVSGPADDAPQRDVRPQAG